jgi:hypothetical protein
MNVVGPSIRQDEALGVPMSDRLDSHQVSHLALGPTCCGHHVRNAVDSRTFCRQVSEHAAQQVFFVESEIVRYLKFP